MASNQSIHVSLYLPQTWVRYPSRYTIGHLKWWHFDMKDSYLMLISVTGIKCRPFNMWHFVTSNVLGLTGTKYQLVTQFFENYFDWFIKSRYK